MIVILKMITPFIAQIKMIPEMMMMKMMMMMKKQIMCRMLRGQCTIQISMILNFS